ncbi:MAG: M1 family aminopeptidase [Armatimonas sp.]
MGDILRFELRFRFRQVSTYVFFLVLFLLAFGLMASDAVKISGGDGQTKANAPIVLGQITGILGAFGAVIASALVGTAIYRDFEAQAHELFFTTRLKKFAYYFGRFIGAFIVTLFVYSGLLWGLLIGSAMPWVDKATLMPFRAASYANIFWLILLPNVFLISALFFVFGAITRSLLAIYALGVGLLVGWAVSSGLLRALDNRTIAALFDPFGLAAIGAVTRYWSLAEKNAQLLPLAGALLWNRLLWVGVGAAILTGGYRIFQFAARGPALVRRVRADVSPAPLGGLAPVATKHSGGALWPLIRFYTIDMVRSVPFLIIVLAGMLMLVVSAWNADEIFDNAVYPVTRIMVEQVAGSFGLFLMIIVTFYSGELVWRERTLKLDGIHDALKVPSAVVMAAKFIALALTLAGLLLLVMLSGMLVQLFKGYTHLEPGLYLSFLFIGYPTLLCLSALAFTIHTVVNQKFLGHTLMIVSYVVTAVLPAIGVEHNLLHFGETPSITYSDMNGYGPFLVPVFWFSLYWLLISCLLLLLTRKLWVRGKDEALKLRWQTGRLSPLWMPLAAGVLATAGWIFYNTNVLQRFETAKTKLKSQVTYEKTYKARWEKAPMPRIVAADLDVTLWPEKGQYRVKGVYTLKNKTAKPISEILVDFNRDLTVHQMELAGGADLLFEDKALGERGYRLKTPLTPGKEITFTFDLAEERRGFPNDGPETAVVANGTFLTMPGPSIGYQKDAEISDVNERRKQGLPPRPRRRPASDLEARKNTYLGSDADWIKFAATVRTEPGQIAIAPGYLQREWDEAGRRCFRYEMDAPIRNFYTFVSARYKVQKDSWTSPEGKKVAVEVYYHPDHAYNIKRMIDGVKAALTYCSKNFSPYQFRQARILEFPAYAQFAQSFPNTIPYSESIGFILKVDPKKPEITDVPFYVSAHEMAHQWWAHQVLGADVEGSEMLAESLAEYSALMTLKAHYGTEFLESFMDNDRDRYLRGRGSEREEENPLLKVQSQQYIHYPKGALVFYALAQRIGEAKLNAVLKKFVQKTAFQEPPYTTSLELYELLKEATPEADRGYLADLFERITLYDLRVTGATTKEIGKKWRTTVTISAAKHYADGVGNETEAPLDEPVPVTLRVGTDDDLPHGKTVGDKIVRLKTGTQTITIDTDQIPTQVIVDPLHQYIDRTSEDNVHEVKQSP